MVLFVKILILINMSISRKKKLGINVEVTKHSLIIAIIFGLWKILFFTWRCSFNRMICNIFNYLGWDWLVF